MSSKEHNIDSTAAPDLHRTLALEGRILDGAATLTAAGMLLGRRKSRRVLEGAMLGCFMLRYAAEQLCYQVATMMRDGAAFDAFRDRLDAAAADYRRVASGCAEERLEGGTIALRALAGEAAPGDDPGA